MAIIVSALKPNGQADEKAELLVREFANRKFAEIPPEGKSAKETDITISITSNPTIAHILRSQVRNQQRAAGVNHAIFADSTTTELKALRQTNGNVMVLVPTTIFDGLTEANSGQLAMNIFALMKKESPELESEWNKSIIPTEYRSPNI